MCALRGAQSAVSAAAAAVVTFLVNFTLAPCAERLLATKLTPRHITIFLFSGEPIEIYQKSHTPHAYTDLITTSYQYVSRDFAAAVSWPAAQNSDR